MNHAIKFSSKKIAVCLLIKQMAAVAAVFVSLETLAIASPLATCQVQPASNPYVSKQMEVFKNAVDIAKQGDATLALMRAKDAKPGIGMAAAGQAGGIPQYPMLDVEYLKTLLSIMELTDQEQRVGLINEAIATVDSLKGRSEFDGRGNPESAYYFMLAVNQLADFSLPLSEPTFVSLKLRQGQIATNLLTNPKFPADGKDALAQPIVEMALGHAIRNDLKATLSAIDQACQLGYSDFEKLNQSNVLNQFADQKILRNRLEELETAYLKQLRVWSVKAVKEFEPFRFNFHADSIRGGSLASDDFEGNILVVDLWATWCPPCREEMPHFQKLADEFWDDDVRVLGMAMDDLDDPYSAVDQIKSYLQENQIQFPCVLGTHELKDRLPGEIKFPTTLFIDRSGTVRYMVTGYQDYAKLAAITEVLINEKQAVRFIESSSF